MNLIRVLDGAMGTELLKRGLPQGAPTAGWNLANPEAVRQVHAGYAAAGSNAITTNTFGANLFQLSLHGLEGQLEEINRAAVANVKSAAPGLPVLGDIGPSGRVLEPYGDLDPDELITAVCWQGRVLAEAGVSAFLVETYSDPAEVEITIAALLPLGLPIIATYAFEAGSGELRTAWGTTPEEAGRRAIEAGAVWTGANCGTELSLERYAELATRLRAALPDTHLLFQPNAGTPTMVDGRLSYGRDAEAFGEWAKQVSSLNEITLGGCCGTTPDHITAIAGALAA